MKIVAMVGSISKDSVNKKLAELMQERYRDKMDIEILNIGELPFFNQDIEDNPPAIVDELRKKILDADGILFVTPEYNYSIPAVLKNAIDWFSRVEYVMQGKPAMIVGAAMGMFGTARAQNHLRDILLSPMVGVKAMTTNEVLIAGVHKQVDENGRINNDMTIGFIDEAVDSFIDWVNLLG